MSPSFTFLFLLSLAAFLKFADAGYSLTVNMEEFSNPDYKELNGHCCDSFEAWGCNVVPCDFKFRFCIEPMQGGTPDLDRCNTSWVDTGLVASNVATFQFKSKTYGAWRNPHTVTVDKPWEGFYFIMRALDDDPKIYKPDDPIDNLLWSFNDSWVVDKTHEMAWHHPRKHSGPTYTKLSFTVKCDANSTGPHCISATTTTTTTTVTTTTTTETTTTITSTATPTTTTQTTTSTTTTTTTSTTTTTTTTLPPSISITCTDWLYKLGENATSGVYDLEVAVDRGVQRFQAYCDMDTDGGGWTVIQRQNSPNTLFNTNWTQYEQGFNDSSDLSGNLWLGNQYIHWLTQAQQMALRVDLMDCHLEYSYAYYPEFKVGDASTNYRLTISEEEAVTGDAGNSLSYPNATFDQNGAEFSTTDRDNDNLPDAACTKYYPGGWWFNACGVSNLNGKYYEFCEYTSAFDDGIFWFTWKTGKYSAKKVEMKVRRTS